MINLRFWCRQEYKMAGSLNWLMVFLFFTVFFPQVFSGYDTYRAAVLEYNPVMIDEKMPEDIAVRKNVAKYIEYMEDAKKKGAEIIVFPEGGLRTTDISNPIPEPHKKIAPCDGKFNTTEYVINLSCAAKKHKIYSVVNILEKRVCDKKTDENCPSRGYYIFNTNAAFDPDGVVIGRYPKFNLFNAHLSDKPNKPEVNFFDTSFGVRFGTFSCFDILFGKPALQMVEQFRINNFIFPTFWFAQLPFLTALQIQRGWAETNNVNLLASGVNFPQNGSGGSGIYHGVYGPLVQIMPENSVSTLIIADVPKKIPAKKKYHQNAFKSFEHTYTTYNITDNNYVETEYTKDPEFFYTREKMYFYNSVVIESGKRFDQKLCSRNNFCCTFRVSLKRISKDSPNLIYRAVVTDYIKEFKKTATGAIQCCGVIICNGPELSNCASRTKDLPGVYKVSEIYVEGEFPKTNSIQMPNTLTDGEKFIPLPVNSYEFKKEEKYRKIKASVELLWPSTNLHTFAIYGRDFSRDGTPGTFIGSSASVTKYTSLVLITSVFYAIFNQ